MTYATCHRCHTVGRAYGADGLPRTWVHIHGVGDHCGACARALRDLESQRRPVGHAYRTGGKS